MPKKKIDYHEHNTDLPETTSVASANECTGLMPSSPKSEAERESFEQLSPMAIPRRLRRFHVATGNDIKPKG